MNPATTTVPDDWRVALFGRMGAGKTTLFHALTGTPRSPAPTPPSTRRMIAGAVATPRRAWLLADAPGLRRSACELDRRMNQLARQAAETCDALLVVAAAGTLPGVEDLGAFRRAAELGRPVTLFLNRTSRGADYADRYREAWRKTWADHARPSPSPDPIDVLADAQQAAAGDDWVAQLAWRFPSARPDGVRAPLPVESPAAWLADVVRGKVAARLQGPGADGVAVEWETFDQRDRFVRAAGVVYLDRPALKGILIGYKGRVLRAVRRATAAEALAVRGWEVAVELRVEADPSWRNNIWLLQRFGYTAG